MMEAVKKAEGSIDIEEYLGLRFSVSGRDLSLEEALDAMRGGLRFTEKEYRDMPPVCGYLLKIHEAIVDLETTGVTIPRERVYENMQRAIRGEPMM